jgi:predicted hotdog family 3-hydroxylacyl-ACP dehydratase
MSAFWPPIDSLVPHKPPMVLLDEVVSHDASGTVCRVRVGPGRPFADESGDLPIAVTLEYMAQCAAVRTGLRRWSEGKGAVRVGYLIGTRLLRFSRERLASGDELDVRAKEVWDDGELASFACGVHAAGSGELVAECVLNAVIPADAAQASGAKEA